MSNALVRTLQSEFLKGNHQVVADTLSRNKGLMKQASSIPLAIGSSVFLGNLETAERTFASSARTLEAKVAGRFFLGLGYTRRSEYAKARAMFAANARLPRRARSHQSRFYIHQGLAFYRFFCGRYQLARKHAQLALENALGAEFSYGEILARDLLGHASVNSGEVRLGLKHLAAALKMAEKFGNGGMAAAICMTVLKFEAQFGLRPDRSLEDLRSALAGLAPDDTYSRAEIYLELARQHILRGNIDQARGILNESCDFIYRNQNRRQAATLNLRFSYLQHLEGQHHQALHLLRIAETGIEPEVDRSLLAQMRGLRAKIERHLGREDIARAIYRSSEESAGRLASAMHSRILDRETGRPSRARVGEDPLGDLIDLVRGRDDRCLPVIVETGFLGLLPDFLGLPFGTKALIFDLIPGSVALMGDGNIRFRRRGLNGLLRKLIELMNDRTVTKEEMIREVWGYDYDPLRHDSLAYSAVTKLRKLIEPFGSWIEFTEQGYRMKSDVRLIFHRRFTGAARPRSTKSTPATDFAGSVARDFATTAAIGPARAERLPAMKEAKPGPLLPELNFRQAQILAAMREAGSLSVGECAQIFMTSKITACRDLTLLNELGHCIRTGKARATRYCPSESRTRNKSRRH